LEFQTKILIMYRLDDSKTDDKIVDFSVANFLPT